VILQRYASFIEDGRETGRAVGQDGARQRKHMLTSGNLHINIVANGYSDEMESVIEPYIYELVGE